jgi:adenylate cyclase
MNDAPTAPSPSNVAAFVRVVETFESAPADRPKHETLAAIAEWMIGPARTIQRGVAAFDSYAWKLVAAGMPLLRATLQSRTLHPQFLGTTFTWWRTTGRTVQTMVIHEVMQDESYRTSPLRVIHEENKTVRRNLEGPVQSLDFPILHDLKAEGATEYLALPVTGAFGARYGVSYACDRAGGFTPVEIAALTELSNRMTIVSDLQNQRWLTRNLLTAYLGAKTGPRVLAGQIRRGMGEEISAVLWSSDLRGFTERSDRLDGERTIAILNALFDAQAKAIHDHGGEILKFIGDGLLAIFPIEDAGLAGSAARNALEAAGEAQAAVARLSGEPVMAGEPPLRIVVALHAGLVTYGNIGAAERLDFTVIGPAVNLVSRIEAVAKALDRPVLVSDDFARAYGRPMTPLGSHALRGLAVPRELFAPLP